MGYDGIKVSASLVLIRVYLKFLFSLPVPTLRVGHCQELTQKKAPVDAYPQGLFSVK
ncbi:hypothetical protein MNBD_GAMMA11-548, partial [hydrothermal vent metagenome]